MTSCDECRFDYELVGPDSFAATVDPAVEALRHVLATGPANRLRLRPNPDVWSASEYCCHVRDVLLVQRDRLFLALVEDTPTFARMYRDERVVLAGYADEPIPRLAEQLRVAADLAITAFGRVGRADWDRPLVYSWPEPRRRDVRWLAAHTAHEVVHHLMDVGAGGRPDCG